MSPLACGNPSPTPEIITNILSATTENGDKQSVMTSVNNHFMVPLRFMLIA